MWCNFSWQFGSICAYIALNLNFDYNKFFILTLNLEEKTKSYFTFLIRTYNYVWRIILRAFPPISAQFRIIPQFYVIPHNLEQFRATEFPLETLLLPFKKMKWNIRSVQYNINTTFRLNFNIYLVQRTWATGIVPCKHRLISDLKIVS